jgi:phage recombination protein Bet
MSKNSLVETGSTIELPQAVADRGYDPASWNTLRNVLFRGASDEAMLMVLDYCKARKLDPLKRPVHIVKVWDKEANNGKGGLVETVWQGINELRTTAQRTGQFAGMDEPKIGPMKDQQVGSITVQFPEWAQVTVYRMIQGHRVPYAGPRAYWLETYAQASARDTTPNRMWLRRPVGQLVKCAEAAALRAAFPEELGHEYAAEEMEGQIVGDEPRHMLQEAGHEPMTLDGDWTDDEPEAIEDAPQSPPQTRTAPKAPPKAPTAANGKAAAGEPATVGKPDWENGDAIPFGEPVNVDYVNTVGAIETVPLEIGIRKLKAAHKAPEDKLSNADWFTLYENNKPWLEQHAPAVAGELATRG